jgi:GT2 family glycosyltransferase
MSDPNPKLSIIMLTYTRSDLLNKRVAELRSNFAQQENIECLILDNGSTNSQIPLILTSAQMVGKEEKLGRAKWTFRALRVNENMGFGPGFNYAVSMSKAPIIFLISDDVAIYGDFVKPCLEILYQVENGIICNEIINRRAGWNEFGLRAPIHYPSGYFLAMWRETWDMLEGFDERFQPCDYEDIDLGMKAKQKGFPIVQLNLPIRHDAAGTIEYSNERYQQTVRMRKLFAEKWGLENIPEVPG